MHSVYHAEKKYTNWLRPWDKIKARANTVWRHEKKCPVKMERKAERTGRKLSELKRGEIVRHRNDPNSATTRIQQTGVRSASKDKCRHTLTVA